MQIVISNELLLVIAFALVLIIVLVVLIPAARGKPAPPHEGEPVVVDFPDKHVHVNVPWQGHAVKVLRLPYPALSEMPQITVHDRPWPHHVVMNVVVARQDDPDTLVTKFEPRLTLKMAYSAEDLRRAKEAGLEQPVFGFWDGCKWVLFTEEKHQLAHEQLGSGEITHQGGPNSTTEIAGHVTVELAAWNDPPIGAGP